MGWFPLDVPCVEAELVLLCLVVEDEAVILVGEAVYVLVKQVLCDAVLFAIEPEEVFYLQGDG